MRRWNKWSNILAHLVLVGNYSEFFHQHFIAESGWSGTIEINKMFSESGKVIVTHHFSYILNCVASAAQQFGCTFSDVRPG